MPHRPFCARGSGRPSSCVCRARKGHTFETLSDGALEVALACVTNVKDKEQTRWRNSRCFAFAVASRKPVLVWQGHSMFRLAHHSANNRFSSARRWTQTGARRHTIPVFGSSTSVCVWHPVP